MSVLANHLEDAAEGGARSITAELSNQPLLARWTLLYLAAFVLSWFHLFTGWPAPLEYATPIAPVSAAARAIATGVLGLEPIHALHVAFVLTLILPLVGALVWDRRHGEQNLTLAAYARIATRYVLAAVLFIYGVPMLLAVYV